MDQFLRFQTLQGINWQREPFCQPQQAPPHLILNRINKMLILAEEWTVGCHFTKFRDFSWYFLISPVLSRSAIVRRVAYTMLLSNNCASFHFCRKRNLAKHKKVLKYSKNVCLKRFLFLVISFVTAKFVKNKHFQARIYFVFLKNVLKQT